MSERGLPARGRPPRARRQVPGDRRDPWHPSRIYLNSDLSEIGIMIVTESQLTQCQ